MMNKFSQVGLLMAYHTEQIFDTYKYVCEHLLAMGVKVLVQAQASNVAGATALDQDELFQNSECLVVVGGDGSLLSVAAKAAKYDKPLIGINRGRLGFLSDIRPSGLDELSEIITGRYQTESRSLLSVKFNSGQKEFLALNEVVLSRNDQVRLVEYDIYIDQRFVCFQRADGLIVSTPTGSTAYALSAGGPILQPCMNAITLVPLSPHRLNSRPIVILNTQVIDLHILLDSQANSSISCDGITITSDETLVKASICKAKETLTLLHPPHYDYFETLKSKLHWERKDYVDQHQN